MMNTQFIHIFYHYIFHTFCQVACNVSTAHRTADCRGRLSEAGDDVSYAGRLKPEPAESLCDLAVSKSVPMTTYN